MSWSGKVNDSSFMCQRPLRVWRTEARWIYWTMGRHCGRMPRKTATSFAASSTQTSWPHTCANARSSMSKTKMRCSTLACWNPKPTEQVLFSVCCVCLCLCLVSVLHVCWLKSDVYRLSVCPTNGGWRSVQETFLKPFLQSHLMVHLTQKCHHSALSIKYSVVNVVTRSVQGCFDL